jgi:hypothetical protein
VIDIDAQPDAPDDQATDQSSQGVKKTRRVKSEMYSKWQFEPAGMRDSSHSGAQCIPCKVQAEKKGLPLDPKGTCLADLPSVLAHVKACGLRESANRQRAAVELKIVRERKAGVKRSASDTEGSSASTQATKKPALSRFLAAKDQPLHGDEQRKFEQLCLQATISANLPFQVWDDEAFRAMLSTLRPGLKDGVGSTAS